MTRAWKRWRRFAHRAAEVQSHVLLFLVYVILLLPAVFVGRLFARRPAPGARWTPVEGPAEDLGSAHHQF